MAFELFTRKKSTSTEATVTILKTGNMFVNATCMEKCIKGGRYINLLFDTKRRVIGIKPVQKSEIYSYSIRQGKKHSGAVLSATSFFKHYNIDYKKAPQRYPVTWNDQEKLVEIKLSDTLD